MGKWCLYHKISWLEDKKHNKKIICVGAAGSCYRRRMARRLNAYGNMRDGMKKTRLNQHLGVIPYIATLLVVLITLSFCFTMIFSIDKRINESATSNLLNTTQVIEGNLRNFLEKDFQSLNVIGELHKNELIQESEAVETLCKTMGFEWVGVALESGGGTGSDEIAFSVKEKAWYNQWEEGQRGFSDAYYGESGRLQTTLWLPIYEKDEIVGTVFGDVLLSKYYSSNAFTFYRGEGRTYLFDGSNGEWILRSLGIDGQARNQADIYALLTESGNVPEQVEAFRQAVEGEKIGTAIFNFNGEISYICFMPLSSSPDWYVATVIAKDVLLKESTQVQRMIRLLLLGFCCVVFAVVIILIRWQNRQTKLREANYREALFANIFSNVDSVFLIYDKEKKETVFVSDNVTRMLGITRQALNDDAGLLFDWCGIQQGDSLRTAFFDGTLDKAVTHEVCVDNKVGLKPRFIRLELIQADMGQEIILLTDISVDKDMENSLREAMKRAESASRAKNDFLSSMSHDLRTPMNGVLGMTAIAAAHLDDKNCVKDCLNKINTASAHLLHLINEILDMSRIESGKIELESEPFNVGELLQEVLNMNLPGIREKNQEVKVHICSMDHEQVVGDKMRVQRIAVNILSNAIKYTPEGGNIFIMLEEKSPEIEGYGCYILTIQDDGIGMSPEFQKRLFQPFEREEDVRVTKTQGTGLGMSIVKNIVSMMMGRIEVESKKHEGTTFRVTVNLKLDEYKYTPSERLENLPVLVVDDDLSICETVTSMLFDIGMTGEWVDNGTSAVDMVSDRHQRGEDYLAVLLDWRMPEVDGIETARMIRARVGNTVPVIILTAYDWSDIEMEALEAGVDTFMSKPVYKTKLMQKMLTLIDKPVEVPRLQEEMNNNEVPEGKRILVVEDNALNREIATKILHMLHLETVIAEDGLEAVEIFEASRPGDIDLILMDIQMPRMNGYEAAEKIRAMEREDSKTIPIVAMTADVFAEDIHAAKAAGMDEHITKPVIISKLVQVLEKFLAGK